MSSEIAIKVENLSKCYHIYEQPRDRLKQFLLPRLHRMVGMRPRQYFREFWALKNISFDVRKGETVGIIGRNGSGKSTLLQMICGTLNPTGGSVQSNGRIAALLELGSGFNPEFTGRENIFLNGAVLGLSREEIECRLDAILAFADIGEFIEQPVKTYSSGMVVRLAFAVIAHVDADILVVDEALSVGDAFFTQKCMRFLRGFMEHGTVLFVSHDAGAVINLCNRVVWLDKGELKAIGDPKTTSEDYLASNYEGTLHRRENHRINEAQKSIEIQPHENGTSIPQDPRWAKVNASTLRNTLEIFSFDPAQVSEFGYSAAKIRDVSLCDTNGNTVLQCVGGELVELNMVIEALEDLHQPIAGFSFKDRLGQVLFGDNTYLTYESDPVFIGKGKVFQACFRFQMPILPKGSYSLATAVATGTQISHRQEHWIHDALIIKSVSSSVSTGLVGIPMFKISLDVEKGD